MIRASRFPRMMRRFGASSSATGVVSSASPSLLSSFSSGGVAITTAVAFASSTAPKNPYKVLGIKQSANKDEIKKAYRVMARKHHPDAPGGNHDKFQEIQQAYEEIKTGVWIQKGGSGDGSGGGDAAADGGRYNKFYYDMRGKEKVSYDQAYSSLHGQGGPKHDDMDDDEPGSKKKRQMGGNKPVVEAWFRFIFLWAVVFVSLRVTLFLCFPPKHHHAPKKPMPDKPRKPPPPKPLMSSPMIA